MDQFSNLLAIVNRYINRRDVKVGGAEEEIKINPLWVNLGIALGAEIEKQIEKQIETITLKVEDVNRWILTLKDYIDDPAKFYSNYVYIDDDYINGSWMYWSKNRNGISYAMFGLDPLWGGLTHENKASVKELYNRIQPVLRLPEWNFVSPAYEAFVTLYNDWDGEGTIPKVTPLKDDTSINQSIKHAYKVLDVLHTVHEDGIANVDYSDVVEAILNPWLVQNKAATMLQQSWKTDAQTLRRLAKQQQKIIRLAELFKAQTII